MATTVDEAKQGPGEPRDHPQSENLGLNPVDRAVRVWDITGHKIRHNVRCFDIIELWIPARHRPSKPDRNFESVWKSSGVPKSLRLRASDNF